MQNTVNHGEIIQLVIAYTLVGAFIFTVVVTCLSLVGIVTFANQTQQRRLFAALILELVAACLGFFLNFLNFNPMAVTRQVADNARDKFGEEIATTIQRANSPQGVRSVQARISTGGGAHVDVSVDGKRVDAQAGQTATIALAQGDHVLTWHAIASLNRRYEIAVEADGGRKLLAVVAEIPPGQTAAAGLRRFAVP